MADPSPCPICGLGGGFHRDEAHTFGIERAKELWGPPLRPALERRNYEPYAFAVGQDEYVVIWRKGFYEVPRGWETP